MLRLFKELTPLERALQQQKELLERERRLAREIRSMYAAITPALLDRIRFLVKQIADARAAGVEVGAWWLYELGRLDSLMQQWQRWAESASTQGGSIVNLARLDVVNLGAAHARAMATAIGTSFQALPRQALAVILDNTSLGMPLWERFLRAGEASAVQARTAVVESITVGENPRLLGRKLTQILNTSKVNGQVIARTESLRAYRSATAETYKLNADVCAGWRWLATQDSRVCPICLAMHGAEFKHSQPFVSHAQCRCTQVPIVDGVDYGADGQALFERMPFSEKSEIFGPVKARLLVEAGIPIRDLVYFEDNKWGGTLKELTLEQMIQRGLVSREEVAGAAVRKAA